MTCWIRIRLLAGNHRIECPSLNQLLIEQICSDDFAFRVSSHSPRVNRECLLISQSRRFLEDEKPSR